jgi:hypothetical protein
MFGRISQLANERFCPAARTMQSYKSQTKHICRMSQLGTTTIRNDPFETNQKQWYSRMDRESEVVGH